MYNFQDKTIRDIAIESPLTTRVFENHKIDYCCGGRVPFTEACRKVGADPLTVLTELEAVLNTRVPTVNDPAEKKRPGELIEHIVTTHHVFTRIELERLMPLAEKVAMRHADHRPELLEIRDIVHELGNELLVHMSKEERMLFPYIAKLEQASDTDAAPPLPPFGTVNNPVRMMMFEHDQAGEMLKKLRSLSADYSTPADACPSFMGLFAGLESLEKDLHQHIHLENNILFPQAINMEERVFALSRSVEV